MRQLGVLIWNSRERSGLLISVMLISTEMATGVLGMEFYQEKGRRLGLLVRAYWFHQASDQPDWA